MICRKCKDDLLIENFQALKDRKGTYTWRRKVCIMCDSSRKSKSNKAYRQRHPDRIKARFKQWITKNATRYKIAYCLRGVKRRQEKREWKDLHTLRLSLLSEWNKQFQTKQDDLQRLVDEGRITLEVLRYLLKVWEVSYSPSLSPER